MDVIQPLTTLLPYCFAVVMAHERISLRCVEGEPSVTLVQTCVGLNKKISSEKVLGIILDGN